MSWETVLVSQQEEWGAADLRPAGAGDGCSVPCRAEAGPPAQKVPSAEAEKNSILDFSLCICPSLNVIFPLCFP